MKPVQRIIEELYIDFAGEKPIQIQQLPTSASDRTYFRLTTKKHKTYLVARNACVRENDAFIYLSKHFARYGIHVPSILHVNKDHTLYVLEDLGDQTLFSHLENERKNANTIGSITKEYYLKAFDQLMTMQTIASDTIDFNQCYPVPEFDRQSMQWDLNYFKYYFLKPSGILFEEDVLEKEFQILLDELTNYEYSGFMFRDFQSRNIMIQDDKVFLIDYQGGRKGPLLYDLASCLLDAKADLPFAFRIGLKEAYAAKLAATMNKKQIEIDAELSGFMLLRILQAFGAYGFRGWFQKKPLFLQSIPPAAANLAYLLHQQNVLKNAPYLKSLLTQITERYILPKEKHTKELTVRIVSFSYKKGIPEDMSTNGGGFVFDCRSLPNPGRLPQMQVLSGLDSDVSEMLENEKEVIDFISGTAKLVTHTIENYLQRGFTDLMVSYGCTGGQHRSVYCAAYLANTLHAQYGNTIIVDVVHRELVL